MGRTPCLIVAVLALGTTAAWAGAPRCLALNANDGALILGIEDVSATRCAAKLEAAVKKRRCPARAAPGTKIEYTTYYEHRGVKGKLVTLPCAPPAPKCRAIEDRTRATIAVASQASSARCAALLAGEVRKERCTRRTRGKKIAYTARFEQRGARDQRGAVICK